MFLLTAPIANVGLILVGTYFIFLKEFLDQVLKSFDNKFRPQ